MASGEVRCLTCGEGHGFPLRHGLIRRLEEVLCVPMKGTLKQQPACLCLNCKTKLEKIEILINELKAVHRRKQAQQAANRVPAVASTTHTTTSSMYVDDDDDNVMEIVEECEVEVISGDNPYVANGENTVDSAGVPPTDNQCGCGETFKNSKQAAIHRKGHHAGKHPCHQPHCRLLFDSHTKLVEHGLIHGFSCFHCPICAAAFLSRDKLAQHKHHFHRGATPGLIGSFSAAGAETINTEDGYAAMVEGMSVQSDDPLVQAANDLQTQEDPVPNNHFMISDYPCPACDSSYLREHHLIKHIARYHWKRDPDTNYLSCTFCNLVSTGLKEILPHARCHRDQMLQCPSCTLVFERKSQLSEHSFKVHETGDAYTNREKEIESLTCRTCGAYADTKSLLCYHRLIAHNANTHLVLERPRCRYPCRYCELSYNEKNDLTKHEKTHLHQRIPDGDPKYDCLHCGSTFNSQETLADHTATGNCAEAHELEAGNPADQTVSQSEQEFPCPVCDVTYCNETHVVRHIQKAHWCTSSDGTACRYSCGFCDLTFDDIPSIALHARSHRKDLIVCKWCPLVFYMDHQQSQHQMEVHKMCLGNKKPQPAPKQQFKCAQCLTVTDTKSLLSFHTLTEHDTVLCIDTQRPAYRCTKCSMRFAQSRLLFKHMQRRHPGAAACGAYFQCNMCQKKLQSNNGLMRHRKICPMVTGKTPRAKAVRSARPGVACYVCGKFFKCTNSNAAFREHMMTHTGKWNYECSQCDVKFMTEPKYKEHLARHTRPIKCEQCGKGFGTKWILNNHMKTHSKTSANICEVCNLDLIHKSALQRHQYEVHEIGDYPKGAYVGIRCHKCNLCDKMLTARVKKRHLSKCHPGIKYSISNFTLLNEAGDPVTLTAHTQPKTWNRIPYIKKAVPSPVKTPVVHSAVKTPRVQKLVKTPRQMSDDILKVALEAVKAPGKGPALAAKPNRQLEAVPLGDDDALRTLLGSTFNKRIKNAYVVKSQGPMTVPIHQLINDPNATVTKVQKANVGEGQPLQYIITYRSNNPSQNESSLNSSSQNSPTQNNSSQDNSSQNNSSKNTPSQNHSSQNHSSQNNSSKNTPSQNHSSQNNPSQNISSQDNPSKNESSQHLKSEGQIYPVLLLNKTV